MEDREWKVEGGRMKNDGEWRMEDKWRMEDGGRRV